MALYADEYVINLGANSVSDVYTDAHTLATDSAGVTRAYIIKADGIKIVNLSNKTVNNNAYLLPNMFYNACGADQTYVYVLTSDINSTNNSDKLYKLSINDPTVHTSTTLTGSYRYPIENGYIPYYISAGTYYSGKMYISTTDYFDYNRNEIYVVDVSQGTINLFLTTPTPSELGIFVGSEYDKGFISAMTYDNGNLYCAFVAPPFSNKKGLICKYSITPPSTPSTVVYPVKTYYTGEPSTTTTELIKGLVVYNNILYVSTNGFVRKINLTTEEKTVFAQYYSSPASLSVYNDTLYTSSYSYSDPFFYAIPLVVLSPPSNTVYINAANTSVVANGNLRVSILDSTNTFNNGVYYEYSLNGGGYINSNVFAGTSPNTLYVLSQDISNTILIRAKNAAGSSTPVSIPPNLSIIYQTPRTPPMLSLSLVGDGNVRVSITETTTNRANYYYLNNVSYYLYAYNTFDGTNLSGNTSLLVYNKPVGILSTTNSTYSTVVSYVNTGLTANTYTMYVIARNDVGHSSPATASVNVYTAPSSPSIDTENTKSVTSGNLTITITDNINNSVNGIYYLYSMDGIHYGNSGVPKTGNTTYSFTINNTGNAQVPLTAQTYTLRVAATNPVGNTISNPATAITNVYTRPFAPVIDTGNTRSITSGNLNVAFTDTKNTGNNQVDYTYFIYTPTSPQLLYF
jgi:hypothetical protein